MVNKPKARKRTPVSCHVCRKRKVKCDKGKPTCSNCERLGVSNLCKYDEPTWAVGPSPEDQLKEENVKLRDRLQQLETELKSELTSDPSTSSVSASMTASVSSGSARSLTGTEPQSTPTYNDDKNDPVIDLTTKFQALNVKKEFTTHFGATSRLSLILNDPVLTQVYQVLADVKSTSNTKSLNSQRNEGYIARGTDVYKPRGVADLFIVRNATNLIARVESSIPTKYICDILFDHFWGYVHTIWPVVDKNTFLSDFDQIITMDNSGRYRLNMKGKMTSYVTLAIFLIILRLSYVTLPYIGYNAQEVVSEPRYRMYQPLVEMNIQIGPEFVDLSKESLSNTRVLRKGTFPTLQYLIYLRIYHLLAPEDEDGVDVEDSTILLGCISQMAITLGCHRDPDMFPQIKNERFKFIWRSLWHMILVGDAFQSTNLGRPLVVNSIFYDTKPPCLFPGVENNPVYVSEVEYFKLHYEITLLIREGAELLMNLKVLPRRSKLENHARKMVQFTIDNSLKFEDLLVYTPPDQKTLRSRRIRFMQMKLFLLNQIYFTYYILYLNCGPDELELSHSYLRHATSAALIIFSGSIGFLEKGEEYFGNETVSLIVPMVLRITQRASQLVISILIRSRSEKYRATVPNLDFLYKRSYFMDQLPVSDEAIKAAETPLMYYVRQFYDASKIFSQTFSHSWKMTHVLWILIGIVEKGLEKEKLRRSSETSIQVYQPQQMQQQSQSSIMPQPFFSSSSQLSQAVPSTSRSIYLSDVSNIQMDWRQQQQSLIPQQSYQSQLQPSSSMIPIMGTDNPQSIVSNEQQQLDFNTFFGDDSAFWGDIQTELQLSTLLSPSGTGTVTDLLNEPSMNSAQLFPDQTDLRFFGDKLNSNTF